MLSAAMNITFSTCELGWRCSHYAEMVESWGEPSAQLVAQRLFELWAIATFPEIYLVPHLKATLTPGPAGAETSYVLSISEELVMHVVPSRGGKSDAHTEILIVELTSPKSLSPTVSMSRSKR